MVAPVRTRSEFDALSRSDHRGRSGPLWVRHVDDGAAPGQRTEARRTEPRVAYAVGRGVGTAVVRNRVRRQLRAVMRELESTGRLGPGLHLIGARADVVELDFAELRAHAVRALDRAVGSGAGARTATGSGPV